MLWTLAFLFLILWAVGLFAHFTAGGVIHVLLLAAVAMVVIRLIQRRQV